MGKLERLWAPWRLEYIQEEMPKPDSAQGELAQASGEDDGCFLCQAVSEAADRQRLVVHRGERSIVVLNLYPYNNGHMLVAPQRHLARLDDLTADEQAELSGQIAGMVRLLEQVMRPQGFNIGLNLGQVAGAGLPGHLHWHIVPRWNGDTNFMSTLAGTRVIPQSLEAAWEMLTEALASE